MTGKQVENVFSLGAAIGALVTVLVGLVLSLPAYNELSRNIASQVEKKAQKQHEQTAAEQGFGEYVLSPDTGLIHFVWEDFRDYRNKTDTDLAGKEATIDILYERLAEASQRHGRDREAWQGQLAAQEKRHQAMVRMLEQEISQRNKRLGHYEALLAERGRQEHDLVRKTMSVLTPREIRQIADEIEQAQQIAEDVEEAVRSSIRSQQQQREDK